MKAIQTLILTAIVILLSLTSLAEAGFSYPSSAQIAAAQSCLASTYKGKGAKRKRTPPTLPVVQNCITNLNLRLNAGDTHACLKSYAGVGSCIKIWWGKNLGKPNDSRANSSSANNRAINLHYQEGQGVGLILGGTTLPKFGEDGDESHFMWGLSWIKVRHHVMHMVAGEATITDSLQQVGLSYGFGLGPSRGMFHFGINVGGFFIHRYDDEIEKHTFAGGFMVGALISLNLGLAAPGFWKGVFGKKGFGGLSKTDERILQILESVSLTIVVRYNGLFTTDKEGGLSFLNGSSGYLMISAKF